MEIYLLGVLFSFIGLAIAFLSLEVEMKKEIAKMFFNSDYDNYKENVDRIYKKVLKRSLLVFPWFSWLNILGLIHCIIKQATKKTL